MKRLLTSCFGLGLVPYVPGTLGSLLAVAIFAVLIGLSLPVSFIAIIMTACAVIGSFICVIFAPHIIADTGRKDPQRIVVDEFSGQALTFLIICPLIGNAFQSSQIWIIAFLAFLLFRIFDISKPFPIKKVEKLPQGWGILADDLLAAVYAGVALILFIKLDFIDFLAKNMTFVDGLLNIFSAAILGIVQGITEFLPVSSSGHLVLFEHFFDFDVERPEMILFDLAVHTGTVIAIFIVFRKSIASFAKNLIKSGKYGTGIVDIYKKSPAFHILVLAFIATVVTALLGFLLEDYFISARSNLIIIAVMWIITGSLLIIADLRKKTRLSLRRFGFLAAVLVGIAQTAAIMPGISRSGSTICVAILLGLHRRWAVEFSFLLAIPAVLGATAVQIVRNLSQIGVGTLSPGTIITGLATACVVGIFALKLLLQFSRRAKLKFFAVYCYILAFILIIYCLNFFN